jgi:hypothetical protein
MEAAMRTRLATALAGFMLGIGLTSAQAQPPRPWCEYGAMFRVPDCAFATFAQCLAMARGDGTCTRNPVFDWPYFQRGQIPPVDTDYYGRPLDYGRAPHAPRRR